MAKIGDKNVKKKTENIFLCCTLKILIIKKFIYKYGFFFRLPAEAELLFEFIFIYSFLHQLNQMLNINLPKCSFFRFLLRMCCQCVPMCRRGAEEMMIKSKLRKKKRGMEWNEWCKACTESNCEFYYYCYFMPQPLLHLIDSPRAWCSIWLQCKTVIRKRWCTDDAFFCTWQHEKRL